ncbi:MAG: Crp/Fnr family transcriptional regulator [Hyphomicrobium sp.]|jgi:CRP-like cAMP-binding protein|nr:Crp/Fnr family transcriptional regulator [Hyphomicrobium sp.]
MLNTGDLATARSAALFASLPADLASTILQQSGTRHFKRGETIFIQGDVAQSIFIVLDGWVKIFRITPTGAEAVVGVFTKGRSFGEAVAFENAHYPVTAESVTDSHLLVVRTSTLATLMQGRPEIAMAILSSTFRHLHSLIAQVEQLKAHTGAQRVAEFLLDLCETESGACSIILPYDKTLIAGRLGMQPQSLSRAFNRLESLGVTISHNMATIADVHKLREYIMEDRSTPWRKAD